jgi:hypothetical protein
VAQHFEGKQSDSIRSQPPTAPTRFGHSTPGSAARADDAPLRELDSPRPSPRAMLTLQRAVGNRAVTQLLRSRTTTLGSAGRTPVLQRSGELITQGGGGRRGGADLPWERILAGLLATLPRWLSAIVQRVAAEMRSGELQLSQSALMAALPVLTALARLGDHDGGAPGGSDGAGAIVPYAPGGRHGEGAIVPHVPGGRQGDGASVPHDGAAGGRGAYGIDDGPWYSVAALLGMVVGADLRAIVGTADVFLTGDALVAAGLAHLIPSNGSLGAPPPPVPLGLPEPPPERGSATSRDRYVFALSFPRREQLAADVFDAAAGNSAVAQAAMIIFVLDPPADHDALALVVALIARIADPMAAIRTIMAERPPLTPQQRQVAIRIAGRKDHGGPEYLDEYLKSTRGPGARRAPLVHPTAGWVGPSGHTIDERHPINRALGIEGEHELLRAHLDPLGRPYGVAQLTPLCNQLLAAGAPAPTVSVLLRSLATHQPTLPRLNRACASVVAMLRVPAFAPHADATLTAHPALLSEDGIADCIGLIAARPGTHTAARLVSLLQSIQPLLQQHRLAFLRRAEQPGPGGVAPPVFAPNLTVEALETRIGGLTGMAPGGFGLTIQQANAEFVSLDLSLTALVNQGICSAGSAQTLREMFQLVPTRWPAIQAFLANGQVRAGLNAQGVQNTANWLRWFVTGHRGAPHSPDPGVTQADPGGRPVVITDWILNHVRERHTFENFDFSDNNINRAPASTFFAAGISDNQIIGQLRHIIGLCGGRPFNGTEIQIGQYQVRIARIPNVNPAQFRFTQFFMGIAIGYAQIPQAVLRLIRAILNP